jgi:hypothetical protein
MISFFVSALCFNRFDSLRTQFNRRKVLPTALLLALAFPASASAQTAQWVKQMGLGGISYV